MRATGHGQCQIIKCQQLQKEEHLKEHEHFQLTVKNADMLHVKFVQESSYLKQEQMISQFLLDSAYY